MATVPRGGIWIHGASVGEARLVAALAGALRRASPGTPLHVWAVTREGLARLPDLPVADRTIFAPLDFPGPVRRAFRALGPDALVLVETELWPNLLDVAREERDPVCVVNARLAPQRLARYRRLRRLYGPLVSGLAAVGAQDDEQARRFVSLGVPDSRVERTGNLKYDLSPPEESREGGRHVRRWKVANPTVDAEPDKDAPPRSLFMVSTLTSFDALGRWYLGLQQDGSALDDEGRALVIVVIAPDARPQIVAGERWPKVVPDEIALLRASPMTGRIKPLRILFLRSVHTGLVLNGNRIYRDAFQFVCPNELTKYSA